MSIIPNSRILFFLAISIHFPTPIVSINKFLRSENEDSSTERSNDHLLISEVRLVVVPRLHARHGERRERRRPSEGERRRKRGRGGERKSKEVSINNARPRLEDVEDRKINHPSSLAFLPTFIRTTIGRGALSGATSSNKRGSSNLSSFSRFLLHDTPPLSPVFFAFHGTNKDRFTSASCDTRRHFLPRHRGPYTMLNYTREYKWQFERSISISGRQLKGKFIRFNRSIKMIEIIFD